MAGFKSKADVAKLAEQLMASARSAELENWTFKVVTISENDPRVPEWLRMRGLSILEIYHESEPIGHVMVQPGRYVEVNVMDSEGEEMASVRRSGEKDDLKSLTYTVPEPGTGVIFDYIDFDWDGILDLRFSSDGRDWAWFQGEWARVDRSKGLGVQFRGKVVPIERVPGRWQRKE